jgi:hypothetical protein
MLRRDTLPDPQTEAMEVIDQVNLGAGEAQIIIK